MRRIEGSVRFEIRKTHGKKRDKVGRESPTGAMGQPAHDPGHAVGASAVV
jgi:hypothetical protein